MFLTAESVDAVILHLLGKAAPLQAMEGVLDLGTKLWGVVSVTVELYPWGKIPHRWIGGWASLRAGLDAEARR